MKNQLTFTYVKTLGVQIGETKDILKLDKQRVEVYAALMYT